MTWKRIVTGMCGFSFGFWLCMPRDLELMPRYEVLVTDSAGTGLPFVLVKEKRRDLAITRSAGYSLATADMYGRAAFPAVQGHTSPLRRLGVCAQEKWAHGVDAPCGYIYQIEVQIPGYAEGFRNEQKLPLKGRGRLLRIVMRTDRSP